jgi:hypothetical protein
MPPEQVMMQTSVRGQEALVELNDSLKAVLVASCESGGVSEEMSLRLSDSVGLALEALDRVDWMTAQMHELEVRRQKGRLGKPIYRRQRSSKIKGMLVMITGHRAVPGLLWADVAYKLEVEAGSGSWSLERSLADFKSLHAKFKAASPDLDLPFPAEVASPEDMENRLQEYLSAVYRYPELCDSREMAAFLVS